MAPTQMFLFVCSTDTSLTPLLALFHTNSQHCFIQFQPKSGVMSRNQMKTSVWVCRVFHLYSQRHQHLLLSKTFLFPFRCAGLIITLCLIDTDAVISSLVKYQLLINCLLNVLLQSVSLHVIPSIIFSFHSMTLL